jgi:hypothetical protein
MAAYFPLTLFYIIILFFKVNTTSSQLFPVVYYCQTLSLPLIVRSVFREIAIDTNHSYYTALKVFLSLYGIWNLDFFRPFYSDLCLGIGILPTLALDYAIAVYPLLLIMASYLLIVLHSRNYRVLTLIWSPFRVVFSLIRKNWNIRTSVIDAFATFFFLSYVKLLSVSFDLLTPTMIYELYPNHYNHTYGLYYAPSIEFFGHEHLPYAILALFVLCTFVIPPVAILALYPFSFFQKCLTLFPVRWHILHTFVDSYYGCYKDGTQPGTRDCRYCVSVFFIIRFLQLLLYIIPSKIVYNLMLTLVLVVATTLIATLRPFKTTISNYNTVNIVFLQLLTFLSIAAVGVSISVLISPSALYLFYILALPFSFIPFLYIIVGSLCWIHTHKRYSVHCLKAFRRGYKLLPEVNISGSLPDRIQNPGGYQSENLTNFTSN